MGTFAEDLDSLTAGMAVTRYINDDDEFNYVVSSMENMGHGRTDTIDALTEWIDSTMTWDCGECDLEGIEEAGWAECPRCGAANPSVEVR